MRKIKIFDTTLRDGEQSPGCSMRIEEKIEIAKMLDEMGVDTIEAGFASSNQRDLNAIKEIAKVVKNAEVVSLARCNKSDIDAAYEAIKDAKKKKIHTFIATSDIHMKYKLNKTREEIIDIVKECVSYAKSKCENIEFSLEDATRSDKDFACKVIDTAVEAGATIINIPDTVGYATPFEFVEFINYLRSNSRLSEVEISVHCHNDLGMATANSLASLKCQVNQIECTVNGIGERAGNTSLEEVVAAIKTRKDIYDCYTDIDITFANSIEEYDKLTEYGLSMMIMNRIPENESTEFAMLMSMQMEDIYENERSAVGMVENIKIGIGKVIGGIIDSFLEVIENNPKGMEELLGKIVDNVE